MLIFDKFKQTKITCKGIYFKKKTIRFIRIKYYIKVLNKTKKKKTIKKQ